MPLEAWIDGACEPFNPGGTASYAVVVKRKFTTILRRAGIVGSGRGMSSNVAEYSGLIALLAWYKDQGLSESMTVYSDSKLLVNQMTGYWRAKRGLYHRYYQEALSLLKEIGYKRFRFIWIPREENIEADELSKELLPVVLENREFTIPPK